MVRGLYSAAGGMLATSQQQDVAAHNLSHANKPGFRREVLRFDATGPASDLFSPEAKLHTDHSAGGLEQTGQPLDVAIDGPGFFTVQGPNGLLFTRCGVFQRNGEGQLVTPDGLAVVGQAGTIQIPAEATSIEFQDDGSLLADGKEIDQLSLATFHNEQSLQRVGSSYFVAPTGMAPSTGEAHVRQGYRELANTSTVHEMVQMTAGLRQFEATQRALRAIGDSIGLATRPSGR